MALDTTVRPAKETGGNLEAQTVILLRLEQLTQTNARQLAALQAIYVQLSILTGQETPPATFLDDTQNL